MLINDVGFENQKNNAGELAASKKNIKEANMIHLKYVDDLLLAEAVDMKSKLVQHSKSKNLNIQELGTKFRADTVELLVRT